MKIINGLGTPTSVVLGTSRFVATARRVRSGEVRTTVRERGRFERRVAESRWFFPRVLRMAVLISFSLPLAVRLTLGTAYVLLIFSMASVPPEKMEQVLDEHFTIIDTMLKVLILGIMAFVVYRARGHHASEHMAIHAFERYGAAGVEHIREQSRLHPLCGGRLAVPGIMVGICSILARATLGRDAGGLVAIGLFETLLWVDARVGVQNLPFFGSASLWFQRVFTTREPTDRELQVGQCALTALCAAESQTI